MDNSVFIADLHVHSKFSRATARDLDFENLYVWAQRKGISVVGTGDFTHPAWYAHIIEKLEPAEPGLYRLKPEIARQCDEDVPEICRAPVRFMLTCEISNIYKKRDKTRKNHNLVFFPDTNDVRRFNARLDAIGNISSDGRPILGLDARDLLEIVLETSDAGFLVPAHIWTPWFSMLGSKSGFDSLIECFEDLSSHIFAAETGLSSDPAMNWRVAELDGITLISNSDAHSPSKLGREANLFRTPMDYYAMRRALETADADGFLGTFEFYPEEGKYHVDGHRKCDICFTPQQTQAHGGICPVCGKPLTLGVLHRVENLATRADGIRPARAFPFHRLIPLENLLADIFQVGEKTKKVTRTYHQLIQTLGSEFNILHEMDRSAVDAAGIPLLGEAITRMRDNRISFSPGFDGVYGKVSLFSDQERDLLLGQRSLFKGFDRQLPSNSNTGETGVQGKPEYPVTADRPTDSQQIAPEIIRLNTDQQAAISHPAGALMIIAGPGTGKTRTLTHKIAHLIEAGADVDRMLAVTFTNKAAREMQERLGSLVGASRRLPFVGTFHGLGLRIMRHLKSERILTVIDEMQRRSLVGDAMRIADVAEAKAGVRRKALMDWIVAAKQQMQTAAENLDTICPDDQKAVFKKVYTAYEQLLAINHLVDFEDLIFRSVQRLRSDPQVRDRYLNRFDQIFIDEYQDINTGQYELIRMLVGDHACLTVIGDPDQSIYGFRGSDTRCFKWFLNDYPDAGTIYLRRNYRSTQTILDVSAQVIQKSPDLLDSGHRRAVYSSRSGKKTINIMSSPSERAEAVMIGKTIEKMVGGTGFFSLDSNAVDGHAKSKLLGFSDFAILFRTRIQADPIFQILEKAGIPCQRVDRRSVMDHHAIQSLISLYRLINGAGMFDDLYCAGMLFRPSLPTATLERFKVWAYHHQFSLSTALARSRRMPIPGMSVAKQRRIYTLISRIDEFRSRVKGMTVADALSSIVRQLELTDIYAGDPVFERAYHRLAETAADTGCDAAALLAALSLRRDTDIYDRRVEKVSLMTLHAAKGLEFPVVFIAGCESGYIPYTSETRPSDPDEERRLFYVGMTRAERRLYLTHASSRQINGQRCDRKRSPFVDDIEKQYIRQSESQSAKQQPHQLQLQLF